MIRLRHDLKDGTTVADQNYRNQSGTICGVQNATAIIAKAENSVQLAVRRSLLPAPSVALQISRTKGSAVNAVPD
jgi:hypothetical protein